MEEAGNWSVKANSNEQRHSLKSGQGPRQAKGQWLGTDDNRGLKGSIAGSRMPCCKAWEIPKSSPLRSVVFLVFALSGKVEAQYWALTILPHKTGCCSTLYLST
jgi:hypothetical protein